MDQPVGQKSKARTFKYQGANGKVHTTVKKNNINSIASEFFPPFVASAPIPVEPKKRVFKVASSTVASSEVPAAVLASVVPAHAKEEEAFEEVKNLEEGVPLERKDEKLEELRTGENELKPNLEELKKKYEECNTSCLALISQINVIESESRLEYELNESHTLIDLLEQIILQPETEMPRWNERMLNLINIYTGVKGKGRLRGGSYFEAIFQLAIAIGALPQFRNKFIRFYDIPDYKRLVEFKDYLHTKQVKNEGFSETGISDISFEVSDTSKFSHIVETKKYECGSKPSEAAPTRNPLYFISVKGFKREKNVAKSYDIPILDRQLQEIEESRPKHIMVCVRNKEKFLSNLSRTRIDFIKNSIKERVIGYDEVIKAFSDFRISFFSKLTSGINATKEEISEKIKELYPKRTVQKGILSLYFHQELVVNSVIKRLKTNTIKDKPYFMCVGVLPRGGKSFIAGGIIDAHRRLKPAGSAYNILFLTSAINETRAQFKDDLVEMFSEFDDFNFVDVVLKSGSEEKHSAGLKKIIFIL